MIKPTDALVIDEEELFTMLDLLKSQQNFNDYSDETRKIHDIFEIKISTLNLDKELECDFSNIGMDLMYEASIEGFKKGFKSAVSLLRTLSRL